MEIFRFFFFVKMERLTDDRIGSAILDSNWRLRPLENWDRGIETHWEHGCILAIFLCLCYPA
jgi:hypothetical protein